MKLHDFIVNQTTTPEVTRLQNLGRALAELAPTKIVETKRPRKIVHRDDAEDGEGSGMDAAIMTLTAGSKTVHSKIKHHD